MGNKRSEAARKAWETRKKKRRKPKSYWKLIDDKGTSHYVLASKARKLLKESG